MVRIGVRVDEGIGVIPMEKDVEIPKTAPRRIPIVMSPEARLRRKKDALATCNIL